MAKSGEAKKASKPRAKKSAEAEVVHAIKGFDADLRCLGYQYEIGKTYKHDGDVRMCASGFHCIDGNPLDVLDYHPLIGDDGRLNRFCSVVASGKIGRDKTSKIVCGELSVAVELTIPELIRKSIAFVVDECKGKGEAVQASSGYSSRLASSGYSSRLASSGHSSQLASSGHSSRLASSGHSSRLASSGHSSQLASSGYSSRLASSGYSSRLASSGDYSKLEITGSNSAAAAVGNGSRIKAAAGTPIAICEYDRNGKPIGFAAGIAGKDGVPADTWLIAKNGKLVENK